MLKRTPLLPLLLLAFIILTLSSSPSSSSSSNFFFSFFSSFASAAGNNSATYELTETVSHSFSDSPSPDDSVTVSKSQSDSGPSLSESVSRNVDDCTFELSVFPLTSNSMAYSQAVLGYPESKIGDTLHYNEIQAVVIAETGFSVSLRLHNGVFYHNVQCCDEGSFNNALRIYTKTRLIESVLVPAEQGLGLENTYKSRESHGLNDYWPPNAPGSKGQGLFKFTRSNHQMTLRVLPISGYRLAVDEWIVVEFFYNSTAPLGCAVKPAIIRATAFRPSIYVAVIGGLSLLVMVCGIVAAAGKHTIPTSHHSSMVAILAWAHFAAEDGTPLPLALSPFQVSFGSSKYRYIFGALYGNALIILVCFLAQKFAMWYVARRKSYESSIEAARTVLYPRITSAVVMHFCGSIMFSCGRSFGNQSVTSFMTTSLTLIFVTYILVRTHRVNTSSTIHFEAEFVPNAKESAHPLAAPTEMMEDLNSTFLSNMRSQLTLQKSGFWRPTDPAGSFVDRFGYSFESYTLDGRSWLLIEVVEQSLTALLSVFDNNSKFLAFYQFGVTLLIKLTMLLYLIKKKPMLASQSATAMLAVYGGQVLGYLALAIGSLRLELRASADMVQGVGCTIAMLGLLYDLFIHVTTGVLHFYDLYSREKTYAEYDETTERRMELTGTFRRGKTTEELELIEKEDKLDFWWDNYGLPGRESKARSVRRQGRADDIIGGVGNEKEDAVNKNKKKIEQQQQKKVVGGDETAAGDENNNSSSSGEKHNSERRKSKEVPSFGSGSLGEEAKWKPELEQDRDWIFGKAAERQVELPFYQQMPIWKELTFEEQTSFFRALFRGQLEPEKRKAVEEKRNKQEQDRAERLRVLKEEGLLDSDEDIEVMKTADQEQFDSFLEHKQQQQQALMSGSPLQSSSSFSSGGGGGGFGSPLLKKGGINDRMSTTSFSYGENNNNNSFSSSSPVSAAASAAAGGGGGGGKSLEQQQQEQEQKNTSRNAAFSFFYDSDGIFIDRYHPLYQERKKQKKQEKILQAQKAAASAAKADEKNNNNNNNSSSSSSKQQKEKEEKRKKELEEEKKKKEEQNNKDARSQAIAAAAASGRNAIADGTTKISIATSETALARDWGNIAGQTGSTKNVSFLTENDFLDL